MDSARRIQQFYRSIGVQGLAERTDETKTSLALKELRKLFSKQQKLLDVGCGYGRLTVPLAVEGYRVSGVDIADNFLRAAKRYAKEESAIVSFRKGDMRDLPYAESSFDGIFCFWSAFNELLTRKDQLSAIRSMRRTLKPGGLAVIDLPDMRYPPPVFDIRKRTRLALDMSSGHVSYLHDAATLKALMRDAGVERYKVSLRNFWGRKRLVLLFWNRSGRSRAP